MTEDTIKEKLSEIMNLVGYGLAKFDKTFAKEFGFDSKMAFAKYLVELHLANTVKSVTNRQDSFDPYFDNGRKGWYQRNQRRHIKLFIDSLFGNADVVEFSNIVKMYIREYDSSIQLTTIAVPPAIKSKFKQLQETGKEAEFYFISNYKDIEEFVDGALEDARLWGDGYDFQIQLDSKYVLAEIKGIREKSGTIRLTQNEFDKAVAYSSDYYLIVVSNLISVPKFSVVNNPISNLNLTKKEIKSIQNNYYSEYISW